MSSQSVTLPRRVTIGRLSVPILALALWYFLTLVVSERVLPTPGTTLDGLLTGFASGEFVSPLESTLTAFAIGFVVAVVAGVLIGAVLGASEFLYEVFQPFVLNIYATPKIILYPVFLFVFSVGLLHKVAFSLFFGIFPMIVITMDSVRNVPDLYFDVARSLRMSRLQTIRHIIFPTVLAHLVVGLRLAFSLTFLGVVFSELFAARQGMGLILREAMGSVDAEKILVVTVILMAIAFAGNLAFYAIQKGLEQRWGLSTDLTEQA